MATAVKKPKIKLPRMPRIPKAKVPSAAEQQREYELKLANALALKARDDCETYCDLMIGAAGYKVYQHGIHHLLHRAIEACRKAAKHLVVVFPPEHGKSSQIRNWLIWTLAHRANLRIGLTSADEDLVKRNMQDMRKTLLSKLSRAIFPDLVPDTKRSVHAGEWSATRLYFVGQHAPGFEAFTRDGASEGARLDIIWCDDCVTRKCRDSEAEREQARSSIYGTWLRRITQGGFCIFSNNVWHRDDPIHKMMSSPSFMTLFVGYSGTDHIKAWVRNPPDGWDLGLEFELDLWPVMPAGRLKSIHDEDPKVYRHLFEGDAREAQDYRFVSADQWDRWKPEDLPLPSSGARIYAHLDPAGGHLLEKEDFAALTLVMVDRAKQYYLIDVIVERATPENQIAACWEMHRKWKALGYEEGIWHLQIEILKKDQKWIEDPIREYQTDLRLKGDDHWRLDWTLSNAWEKKGSRIERVGPFLLNGWLKVPWDIEQRQQGLSIKAKWWERFVAQIEDYPYADHDDGPDSLAGVLDLAEKRGPEPLLTDKQRQDREDSAFEAEIMAARAAENRKVLRKRDMLGNPIQPVRKAWGIPSMGSAR